MPIALTLEKNTPFTPLPKDHEPSVERRDSSLWLLSTSCLVPVILALSASPSVAGFCMGTAGNDSLVCDSPDSVLASGGTYGDDEITINGGSYVIVEGGRGNDTIIINGGSFTYTNYARVNGDNESYYAGNTPGDVGRDTIIINGGTFTGVNIYGDTRTVNGRSPNLNDDIIEINGGSVESVYGDDGFGNTPIALASPLQIGNDTIRVTGGEVKGEVATDTDLHSSLLPGGNDVFEWSGGTIAGRVFMGRGNDTALITASEYDGSNVIDGGDDYSGADGWFDALTLQGLTVGVTGANLLNWELITLDGGTVSFTDNALTAGSDAGAGLVVTNGATLDAGAAFALTGNLATSAGGIFDATGAGSGSYSVSGSLANDGNITMLDGVSGDSISVAGDYTGAGQLILDADFSTASADTLVIAGDVTASATSIVVTDIAIGPANGDDVLLVDVTGTTSAGDFVLSGGAISAGIYTYDLSLSNDQWLLTGTMTSSGSAYEVAPSVLSFPTVNMPTLEQRVGQRQWAARDSQRDAIQPSEGAWLKINSSWMSLTPAVSTSGASYDLSRYGVQFGIDARAVEKENGYWIFGLTGQYNFTGATVASPQGTGAIQSESYGVGGTATWYGHNGLYMDAQAQINWVSADLSSSSAGSLAENIGGTDYVLSVELGKRIALKDNQQSSIVPQAQLTWETMEAGAFTDNQGNTVNFGANTSLVGRVGLAYVYEYTEGSFFGNHQPGAGYAGYSEKFYVIGNIIHDFSEPTSVDVNGAILTAQYPKTWAEIGIGGSIVWDEKMTLYTEGSYKAPLDNAFNSSSFSATVGFRYQW